MMKMRKLFFKLSMLLFVLAMSVNAAWGDDGQPVYLAAFKAQMSGESTGAGKVKLTWVDAQGELFDNTAVAWLNYTMPYGTGNPSNEDDFDATAMVIGATMTATESVEDANPKSLVNQALRNLMFNAGADSSHLFMTPFAYFKADAQANNGSYFVGWTFNDARVWQQDTAMDKSAPESAYFKVLPNSTNVMYMTPPASVSNLNVAYAGAVGAPNNIYAVFNKYLLGNPTAASANLEAQEGASVDIAVTVEVEGDAASLDAADFGTFAFSNNANSEWSYDLSAALASKEVVSTQKTRITIPVTYTYKNGEYGLKNTTMTILMASISPSTLNVNLSVNALNPTRPEAFLLDGKAEQTSGDLSDLLNADFSTYANPILKLNKPVNTNLTLPNKTFTFDLNGNEVGDITIAGGEVTIAFSKFGGEAGVLSVTDGKAILEGGTFGSLMIGANGEVEQNGATITGAATNAGSLTTTEGAFNGGLTSSKTLVLNGGTFKGDTAITVSGGTAAINRGAIEGTNCGLKVTAGTATVKKLAAIKGGTYSAQRTGGTLIVECGKFDGPLNGSINFTAGFFKNVGDTVGLSAGKTGMLVSAGVEYNEGYRYFLGTAETAVSNGVGVCRIGNVSYAKLESALDYANNNPGVENIVIFMTNNYTLPAGYYTLPANATIVVPMSDTQAKEINYTAPRLVYNDVNEVEANKYENNQPTEFRRLTFASGVNMDVFGDIEITCSQYSTNEAYTSQPVGPYGHLVMEEGSHMTLQDGSELRAWGFMTGKGETDARRGSIVREMFQMGDWKGAMTSVKITGMVPEDFPIQIGDDSDKKIFPVTQYFIQNVESPVKYHPGSLLSGSAAVSEGVMGMSISMAATDIGIVGVSRAKSGGEDDPAIFLMDVAADAENTWVRKWYDAKNDIQVYDINSGAHIGSMTLDLGELSLMGYTLPVRLNSAKFDLPLTCNFKIHLLTGGMDFKQNTSLLPGAEVEVDKEAIVSVAQDPSDTEHTGALYVYDANEWDNYAYPNKFTKVVRYAPSWNGLPTKRNEQVCPPSAAINVHGTFQTASGFVYTSEHGANIFSSNEDAGTFIFNDNAADAGTRTVWNVQGVGSYEDLTFYPARLRNGNGEYVNTDDAEAGAAYCYQNDKWSTMTIDEDNPCFMETYNGNTGIYTYYAKPAEYVAVVATKVTYNEGKVNEYKAIEGNADHTYSDAAGAGRLFILMDNCQWWEVENVNNLYHCIHPNNDTYYYWDEDEEMWMEKKFTITWKNWDGSIVQTADADGTLQDSYEVAYGTMAEFLGTNPTRDANIDSTYNFTGWKPALGPVTQDVTYTATFESQPRMYTIIFQNEGGSEIERQFLTHNEVPVCENVPTKVGHYLIWSPAISPVIKDQTYVATWEEELPTEWDVTFVNNAGGVLKSTEKVGVNDHPTYTGSTPVKENADHSAYSSNEYTYTFWGWSAVIDGVAQQFAAGAELPCPTAPTTYTAVYTEDYQTYAVTFRKENPENPGQYITIETNNYRYGETPVCSDTPTKENTAEWTYGFAWTPQIQTVMGDQVYTATFPATKNKYTVTLTSNLSGVCTFVGSGTYDYGKDDIRVSVIYNKSKYSFTGWTGTSRSDTTFILGVLKGDSILTANFTPIALSDHTVSTGETWNVTEDTEVKDLILTSDGSACGQLLNPENLTIRGEAIFRMAQSFAAGQWYAVAVPWRVNPATGIYGASGRLASGSQVYIIEFDGTAYANVGGTDDTNQYWHFLHETGADMVPGKLYMIYLRSAQSKLDFHKKAGAALQTRNLTVSTASGSAGASFANWNAISNPALYTADLSTGVTAYQTYDNNGDQTYTLVDAATSGIIVAKPIFVQVNTPSTVYATVSSSPDPAPAYRRAPQAANDAKFVVEISSNDKMADRLIVETADEKENLYVIGQDLSKFGVSKKVAQMWINRYDSKLCKNTVEFEGERAEYPLSIYAPTTGEYTLSSQPSAFSDQIALYLTRNGEAIWNLSEGDYVLSMEKGTSTQYGLRISAKAPQNATGVDEAVVDAQGDTKKVLINDKVYIIRGDRVYTVDGQLVK
jgi:hypothetical protein